jgi:carbon starvation protein
MHSIRRHLVWLVVAVVGAFALGTVALTRGESVNALWVVAAAICTYLIAYRYYSLFIADKVLGLDGNRKTPAHRHNDGLDYVPTDKNVLFGHHFAAIAGAGPLVGPVLAAQMGYLPGLLWVLAGVVFAGAVQDFIILFISTRRDGRSLGDLVKQEMGVVPGMIALFGTFMIMIIILAVLALIVVKALAESPWGTFTVAATIPVALFMGVYLRFIRPGRIGEVSLIGFVLLMLAIFGGQAVSQSPEWAPLFTFDGKALTWMLVGYGFVAASLPVWLLLAPRDYLSTFLKIGTIIALAIGIVFVMPTLQMPAITQFAQGNGPVWSGSLFPFLFITIACGAVSGFHALISSGTTPKMLDNERHARFIGYGGMLAESFVAVMALVAASCIEPGVYFAMNSPAALVGTTAQQVAATVSGWGFVITPEMLLQTAKDVGETTILGRAGGAPTLAVGMAHILHQVIGGQAMMAFWYHFAILFEALFILTAVDAGTRAGRFMLQDLLGSFVPALKRTDSLPANLDRHGAVRGGVGLLFVPGRGRPAGRHQHAVAAVRHLQPDAGRGGADARRGGAVPHEARALRVGGRRAGRVAAGLHAHGGLAEDFLGRPEDRFPVACGQVHRRPGQRRAGGAGQDARSHVAHRVQRPARRGAVRALHVRGAERAGVQHQGLPGGARGPPADHARNTVRACRRHLVGGALNAMGLALPEAGAKPALLCALAQAVAAFHGRAARLRRVPDPHGGHPPGPAPMSYEVFFRERLEARYGAGKGRCC